jgi:haloalkane dehalogenase
MPHRFSRLLAMNTSIATGQAPTQGFINRRTYSNHNPDMKITAPMQHSCHHLSKAEAEVYSAPFPDVRYSGGVRRFPNLVMTSPKMEGADVSKVSLAFHATSDVFKTEDMFMACRMQDPVLGLRVMGRLAEVWKNGISRREGTFCRNGATGLRSWQFKCLRPRVR